MALRPHLERSVRLRLLFNDHHRIRRKSFACYENKDVDTRRIPQSHPAAIGGHSVLEMALGGFGAPKRMKLGTRM